MRFKNPARTVAAGILVALSVAPSRAEEPSSAPVCGTTRDLRQKLLSFHLDVSRRADRAALLGPGDQDIGEIAVLVDDGTLLSGGVTNSVAIIQRFYVTHPDYYDYVVILNNAGASPEAGFAFESNVRALVGGIGYQNFFGSQTFDFSQSDFGFTLVELDSFLNMNHLGRYDGPDTCIPGFPGCVTGTEVMGQEAMHQFGAFARTNVGDVLGRGEAHWSFFYDTNASVMEGNRWTDNGDGTFTTAQSFDNFAEIDLYLWGVMPASDVTYPGFLITNVNPPLSDSTFPQTGVTRSGTRVNISVADFIAREGPRVPGASEARHDFKYAYVLVVPNGTTPSQADLDEMNAFRSSWEAYFAAQSGGRGSADTALTTARFVANVQEGLAPLEVAFTDASYGAVSSRLWDFGDGVTSTDANPAHTYAMPGNYTVSLTVTTPSATRTRTEARFVVVGSGQPLFDDFEIDRGFTSGAPGDTATDGFWTRGNPNGTFDSSTGFAPQPEDDHTPGPGVNAYVTGNEPGATGTSDDVDGGVTSLLSPVFDLSGQSGATLVYYHYGYSRDMSAADTFTVDVSNDGGTTWTNVRSTAALEPRWLRYVVELTGSVPFTNAMRLRFQARDVAPGNEVEAALDDVRVFGTSPVPPAVTAIVPSSGPLAGGTSVTVTGSSFTLDSVARIDGSPLSGQAVLDPSTITGSSPAGSAYGPADVSVTNSVGTGTLPGGFTYDASGTCDLAVLDAVVDYDPATSGIDAGPGKMGQAVDVVLTVRNAGSLAVTSASVEAEATLGSSVARSIVVADFDSVAPGVQPLAPSATAAVRVSFESGALARCGEYALAASHDGAALRCADGPETKVGDDASGNDSAPSPPGIVLGFGIILIDVRPESETIDPVATERLRTDVRLTGFTPGLPSVSASFSFDVVDATVPDTVVRSDIRPAVSKNVPTGINKATLLQTRLDVMPALPVGMPLRLRITMRDRTTGETCAVGVSDPFTIDG